MRCYKYEALDGQGRRRQGLRVAPDRESLEDFFAREGLTPVSVETAKSYRNRPIRKRKLLARFFRNLALFLDSGMDLLPALTQVKKRLEEPRLTACVETITADLKSGRSFGDSLRDCRPFFPESVSRLCAVGEQTGELKLACRELSDYFKTRHEFLEKLYNLLLYPFIVAGTGLIIFVFLLVYVLPRLAGLLRRPDTQLPLLTRLLLGLSDFVQSWYILPALVLVAMSVWAIYRGMKTTAGQRIVQRLCLRSELYKKIKTQLFALSMAMCLRVGLDMGRALALARDVLGNRLLKDKIDAVMEDVRTGRSLTDSLREQGFETIPFDSLEAGEQSGNLDRVFDFQSDLLQAEVDEELSRLVTLFEPAMVLVMTGLVGLVLAAVMLPIVQMSAGF